MNHNSVGAGSDDEKIDSKGLEAFQIDPESNLNMIWNSFTNLFYMISFFTGPLILAFEFKTFERQRYFELFLDFIMLCDIATEFFTSRMHKGKKITKLKSIAKAYIKSTFIFDILACLPGLITLERHTGLYYLKIFRYL